jgi:hypothetical protein
MLLFLSSLLLGVIAAAGTLVAELIAIALLHIQLLSPIDHIFLYRPLVMLLALAFIEEAFKYLFLTRGYGQKLHQRQPVLYTLGLGLGFAGTEIFLLPVLAGPFISIDLWGLLGMATLHLTTLFLMSFWLRTSPKAPFLAPLGIATLLHFAYNYSLFRFF